MAELKLKVDKRELFGRKVKKLRKQGLLPANIYGKGLKSQAVKMGLNDFLNVYKEAGETGIVKITFSKEAKERAVLIHNFQKDPVTDSPLHVDFHQVDLKVKVQVSIPVILIGESEAVAKGGVLVQQTNEVEVEALPSDLPDKFEIDISKIKEIGQGILVKDLKIDIKKVKILIDNMDQIIVRVEEPRKEEEEEAPSEEATVEGEEAKPEEGETSGDVKADDKKPEEKQRTERGNAPKEDKKPPQPKEKKNK